MIARAVNGFQAAVGRAPGERPGRGRDAAGREHDQEAARAQALERGPARVQVGRPRGRAGAEVDRQQIGLKLGCPVERVVGQDLEVGPHLGDQVADQQAVEDPERMVRDHDDRAFGRDRQSPLVAVDSP